MGTTNIMKERLILLPVNYIILPAVAIFLSGFIVSGSTRFFTAWRRKATARPKKASAKISQKREKARLAALPKAGRNEPCPCGSGKKFKRCCGKAAG